jgi:rhodanese-related sulfurtransferase
MEGFVEFAGGHPWLVAAAVIMTIMVIGYEIRIRSRGFGEVGPAEAVRLINQGAIVLDLRNRDHFDAGHIINAEHIPPDMVDQAIERLRKRRETPLITCCDSGMSSSRIAGRLHQEGFSQVFNLRGGLSAWRQENLPLTTKKRGGHKKRKGGKA